MSESLAGWPAFTREIRLALPVHAQFVLWGDRHDHYLIADPEPRLVALPELLRETLAHSGCQFVLWHDLLDGPVLDPPGPETLMAAQKLFGETWTPCSRPPDLLGLRGELASLARPQAHVNAAAVIDASQLLRNSAELTPAERDFFRSLAKLARTARRIPAANGRSAWLHNPIIWLVDREAELPAWFTSGAKQIRSIALPTPDLGARRSTAALLLRQNYQLSRDKENELSIAFAQQANGLGLKAMLDVTRLALDRKLEPDQFADAIRLYKYGVPDNPWSRDTLRAWIVEHGPKLGERVLGQQRAVTKAMDNIKRAVLGFSGARAATRPRAVLFLVGPTGVGKTELAKAIAELIFGDDSRLTRFDMSEFAAEHAGERLIGAPPGYVGFEAGGELTNAVRQQPFQVILFDEIEKAHHRILDKFLQILDDGRLTDGRGNTVFFSDSVLVFTSNLGMYDEEGDAPRNLAVQYGTDYAVLEARVLAGVQNHFIRKLKRPELLNRLGDNIIVFDFISLEAADQIFELRLAEIVANAHAEHGVDLIVDPAVLSILRGWCAAKPVNGGRGIRSDLESRFTNPLARAMFDLPTPPGSKVVVRGIFEEEGIVSIDLECT